MNNKFLRCSLIARILLHTCNLSRNDTFIASWNRMLRKVEVISIFCNIFPQPATWKVVLGGYIPHPAPNISDEEAKPSQYP